jgi:hypothetical protein
LLARNSQREGTARLKDSNSTQNYEWSVSWKDVTDVTVIDNGSLDIEAITKQIIEHIS